MIDIRFTNECVADLNTEMRALLAGDTKAPSAGIMGTQEFADAVAAKAAQEKRPSGRTRAAAADKAATQQAISTGEERTDPAVDKQDAADEAADTAATKAVDLTHDDVKKMLGGYVQAYGMAAAQEDGTGFIGAPKISEIPNTQAALAAAIIGIAQAIEKNPKKRDIAGDGLSAEKTVELKPIVAAAIAVK